jgi:heat shock protein HtpX
MFQKSFPPIVEGLLNSQETIRPPSLGRFIGEREPDYEQYQLRSSTRTKEQATQAINPEPTQLSERSKAKIDNRILNLNLNILAGEATRIGLHAAAITTCIPFIVASAPTTILPLWLGLTATTVAASLIIRTIAVFAANNLKNTANAPHHQKFKQRVEGLLESLINAEERKKPRILIMDQSQKFIAGMLDNMFVQDLLIIGSQIQHLSDRELKGVVAHEVAHSDRSYTKSKGMNLILQSFASPAVFVATFTGFYAALLPLTGSFLASECSWLIAGAAWFGFKTASSLLGSYISRQNELKTDLRAVKLAGDPSGLADALRRITEDFLPKATKKSINSMLSTHPKLATRLRNIWGSLG